MGNSQGRDNVRKRASRAKLTEGQTIWLELRKGSPLTPQQKTSLEEIEKALSKL